MATTPARLTFVPVPFAPSGISVPQLAKRLGVAADTIWYPIRPNSRTVDVNEVTGIAIVLKSAFANALSKLSATSPYEPFTVSNQIEGRGENANTGEGNGNATRVDGGVAATAMISNRLRMIRAMRGIGDGRKMQLNFRFIPPQYVCFVQAPPNCKLVLSKASKDAMGGEDPLYALAMLRAATYEELLAEGCTLKPAAAETTSASSPAQTGNGGGVVSESGVGQKRSRAESGSGLREGEATAVVDTKREKRKVSELTKIMQTPEGAFLSDLAGVSTHSELWLSVKSNVSANGLHKPPLHKSKLFYPAGVSATSPVPPTTTTTKYNSNTFSSDANNSAKRVVINNVSWQMLEPHCVSTSFNFGLSSSSVGSYSAAAQLSTSKIAAIIIDGAFLSSHRYFRGTAHATAALMGSVPILASGNSNNNNNENSTVGDAITETAAESSGPSAMAVATAFESAVRQHHGLSESINLVVGGTRETPFSPQAVGPSGASGVSHFQQIASIFQQRCRELALQGFRVVLFASAPELHHADQESIEDKLTSMARCVASLVTAPSSLPMPPITLMVSVASAVTSSFSWGMGYQQNESAKAANSHSSSCSSVSVNAKMLWRAFVRHMNQNKFPSEPDSFVVSLVGRKSKRGAGGNDKLGQEEDEDEDRAESTTALSDVASFATAPIALPQEGRYNLSMSLTTVTSPDPSKTQGALRTLAFLTSNVDAVLSREFVSEDGKALRLVSTKAFLEGRAMA